MNACRPSTHLCRACRYRLIRKRPFSCLTGLKGPLDRGFTLLRSRRLIAVHGQDAAHFLQGLTTQNIPTSGLLSSPASPQALYSAFMTAQGRLLNDVFIYPIHPQHLLRDRLGGTTDASTTPTFLVEVDAEQVKSLHAFLRKYKLRAKVSIRVIDEQELGVYGAWSLGNELLRQAERDAPASSGLLVASDTRIPESRSRMLATTESVQHVATAANLPFVDEHFYRARRYLDGVAEGQHELPKEETLLHEANVDLMQGVDFRKGCYVGQELVIRTQHTGVVRKRIMPFQVWTDEPPSEADLAIDKPMLGENHISDPQSSMISLESPIQALFGQSIKPIGAKRPEGKLLAGIGNIGLGLFRLDKVISMNQETAVGSTKAFEIGTKTQDSPPVRTWIRPFIPSWWTERGQRNEGGFESMKARSPGSKR